MYAIRDAGHLRMAYSMLDYYNKVSKTASDHDLWREHIKDVKRAIREYTQKPVSDRHIVKDYGIDGFVVLFPLPAFIQTPEQADKWFMQGEYIQPTYSTYDCTGRPFTKWYKIFWRKDGFWVYHSIGYDV